MGTDYCNRLFAWIHLQRQSVWTGRSKVTDNGVCGQPDYVKLFDDADIRKNGSFLLRNDRPQPRKVIITAHDRPLITADVTIIQERTRQHATCKCNEDGDHR